jgi:hypothetical protein
MSGDVTLDVSALAINVTIPDPLRWMDTPRGEEFILTTLNVRLLPDGRLAAKSFRPLTRQARVGSHRSSQARR